jgi:hypothetical protein
LCEQSYRVRQSLRKTAAEVHRCPSGQPCRLISGGSPVHFSRPR